MSRFTLKNGKFVLTSGAEKASDSVWFFCIFDKFRVYCSDFGARLVSLTQKPVSYILLNRTLIIGSLRMGIQKYTQDVKVNDIDFGYTRQDKKEVKVKIEFSAMNENKTIDNGVTFV